MTAEKTVKNISNRFFKTDGCSVVVFPFPYSEEEEEEEEEEVCRVSRRIIESDEGEKAVVLEEVKLERLLSLSSPSISLSESDEVRRPELIR